MSGFLVKIAENQKEVKAAQRLRFKVFNVEMKRGLSSSYESGLDIDEYDEVCDHILIIDKKKNEAIGTYRLLLRLRLKGEKRFYSEGEFDLRNIRKLKGEILEMGRSCVHKDYRRNSIVALLWSEIIKYIKEHRVEYIIGCPSLYTDELLEINKIYTLMKKSYFAPEELRVWPRAARALKGIRDNIEIGREEKNIFLKIPSLVRSYIKVGAYVCGEPARDDEFHTVDFFMLLEVAKISSMYLRRFGLKEVSL